MSSRLLALLASLALLLGVAVAPLSVAQAAPVSVDRSYGPDSDQDLTAYYDPRASGAPWVMVLHGGSWSAGSRTNAETASLKFRDEGFHVFNVEYRKTSDYNGNPGVPWALQFDDVVRALDYIRSNAAEFGIDPSRGAVYGFSAGGHLAAQIGLRDTGPDRLNAVVSASGVLQPHRVVNVAMSDNGAGGDQPTTQNRTLMGWAIVAMRCPMLSTWTDCNDRWQDFKPETHITSDDPPFLIFQGTADPAVPPATGRAFAYWLGRKGVPSRLIEGTNWSHTEALPFDNAWRQDAMTAFLKTATS